MQYLFVDESGDHNLIVIDDQYPVFVLAGIILDENYHNIFVTNQINSLKQKLFGNEKIILHTADISRNKNGYERLKSDKDFRYSFYNELNNFIENLDFKIIAAAVRKKDYKNKYGLAAVDPYLFCLEVLIERFIYELQEKNDKGMIIAESRNSILDNQLEIAFLETKISGTRFLKSKVVKEKIVNLVLREKSQNIPGLQLADLVASPIGRFVIGKKSNKDFEIIQHKFRKNSQGNYLGYGLVIFP